jgi:hypothetical protein
VNIGKTVWHEGLKVTVTKLAFNATQDPSLHIAALDRGLGAGTLLFGRGTEAQAVMPVGAGELVANEPRVVLTNVKVKHRDLRLTLHSCELRADLLEYIQRQTAKGEYVLSCWFDLQYIGNSLHWFRVENMRLKLPDGTTISALEPPNELMQDDRIIHGVYTGFSFTWPAPGQYFLQIVDPHGDERPSAANTYQIPFTVGAA